MATRDHTAGGKEITRTPWTLPVIRRKAAPILAQHPVCGLFVALAHGAPVCHANSRRLARLRDCPLADRRMAQAFADQLSNSINLPRQWASALRRWRSAILRLMFSRAARLVRQTPSRAHDRFLAQDLIASACNDAGPDLAGCRVIPWGRPIQAANSLPDANCSGAGAFITSKTAPISPTPGSLLRHPGAWCGYQPLTIASKIINMTLLRKAYSSRITFTGSDRSSRTVSSPLPVWRMAMAKLAAARRGVSRWCSTPRS